MKIQETQTPEINGENLKIAIVLPYFNERIGLQLLEEAKKELAKNKVQKENISLTRVAGALEIPFACKKIIEKSAPDAIITLGAVIKGETSHYDLVTEKTYEGIMQIQLEKNTPITFGVLTCEDETQAKARIPKGAEVAKAALIQATI